jgi:hypothetical protein
MSKQTAHDISSLCAFTYADNRHCRMPRASIRSRYCEYHRRKLLPLQSSADVTASLYEPIGQGFVPVTGLTQSLARLFACVAEGTVKAKDAVAMTRVAETLLKTIPLSDAEFKTIYLDEYRQQLLEDSFGELPPLQPPDDHADDQDDEDDPEHRGDHPEHGDHDNLDEPAQPDDKHGHSPKQAELAASPGLLAFTKSPK